MPELELLPAGETVARGLRDLERERQTAEALLVAIAGARLEELGLTLPPTDWLPKEKELALYGLLCRREEDPYYAYCSLLESLDSFLSTAESFGFSQAST